VNSFPHFEMPLLSNKNRPITFASLEGEARERAANGDGESWVFIVPNRIAQRRMERGLLEAARGRTLSELNILTLSDLAAKLAISAYPGFRLIGDGESAVLIEMSIRELLREHKLSFFEGATEEKSGNGDEQAFPIRRGTFELVVNTIRQLKESGVAPENIESDLLKSQSKGETTEVRRARDILAIYQAYQARVQEHKLMDTHGQMLLVNVRYDPNSPEEIKGSIREDFSDAFPNASEIFISGFYYLEPPSIKLISRLAGMEHISISIELEENKNNPDLFAGLIDLDLRLRENGFHPLHRAEQDGDPLAHYIGKHLFRANEASPEEREAISDGVTSKIQYFTASDVATEVEEIARHIKLIYHSDPEIRQDLSLIVVATPSSEAYTPLFEEIFRRHDIPVQIADRYHLDRSPLVLALLALLDAARTNLRKRELIRMLASPYFNFEHACGSEFDARNLLDILSRYKQTGDTNAITRSLTAHRDQIQSDKEESEDSGQFARAEAEENRIRRAIKDIERIQILLRPLMGTLTPQEFCNAVRTLLSNLRAQEQILASSRVTIAVGTLENDTRAYRALVKLLEELESLFHVMHIADEKRSVTFFEHRLKAALIVTRYTPRARSRAVHLTSLAQSISQPAKYLFLAGLTGGTFPAPYQPQVFLTSGLQKGERKQLLEDRVLFYQALTNFKEQLYLSYPKKSSGAEVNKSGFFDSLEEILKIEAAAKPAGIFSCNDLYRIVGQLEASKLASLEVDHPSAPWLRTIKEQIPRSSEGIRARMQPEDSIYRGTVDPSLLTEAEKAFLEYNKSRVWSVTQLELYAMCPFRYFARDVLGLGEEQEMEEGLDARDRGSALHEVLRQFLISRREQNLPSIQDIPESELGAAYAEVRQLAEDHFKTIASEHPFWRLDSELLLSDNKPDGSILWKFIKKEKELGEFELRPKFFEVSFGGAGHAPKTPTDATLSRDAPIDLGGFALRGKIDRIDIPKQNDDGSLDGDVFSIIDYKSGKEIPRWSDIERGLSLQLPLYLRVAEDLLRSHFPELRGVAALYHKLLDPESKRKLGIALQSYTKKAFETLGTKRTGGLLESEDQLAEIIDQAVAKARTYVDGVAGGKFPLIEADLVKNCVHCPYGSVCRVNEAEEAGVLR
jgi:ATP-dependent helicase/nuclease subunit B